MHTVRTPHEFLVRWDDAGNLQGAHTVHREAFVDDAGVVQISRFLDPQPIALTDTALLQSIGADINVAALQDGYAKADQIADLVATRDAQLVTLTTVQRELASTLLERDRLRSREAELSGALDAMTVRHDAVADELAALRASSVPSA